MLATRDLVRILGVDGRTIARWSRQGRLETVWTPGGHRRFPVASVLALLREFGLDEQAAEAAVSALA